MGKSEDKLVANITRRLAGGTKLRASSLSLGPGDDAAVYRQRPGNETILTCDWFLEGTHFVRRLHPPDSVGWKCMARAVSDVAAMGAAPAYYLLSLALPADDTGPWLDAFLGGLRRASGRFRCALAGGDTTIRNKILIHLTIVGHTKKSSALRRSGARAGDVVFVSGRLGEAELGLRQLRRGARRPSAETAALRKHLYPQPRIELGQWLAKNKLASAMMDLSDGLSTDLQRLCKASGVGARIASEKLPLPEVDASVRILQFNPLQLALHGGDDYELLFTVPRQAAQKIPQRWRGLPLTAIGEVTRTKKLILSSPARGDIDLIPEGWDPFRG